MNYVYDYNVVQGGKNVSHNLLYCANNYEKMRHLTKLHIMAIFFLQLQ